MSEFTPLAIVGMSCLFPKAEDLQAYWSNIKQGIDAIGPVPDRSHWKIDDYFDADPKSQDHTYAKRGGFISPVDFNPMEFGIAPKDVEATDTTQLLGLVAAKQALADSGYGEGGKDFDRARTGVILGVTGALELVIPLGARLGHPIWRRALKEAGISQELAEDVVQRISDGYVGWQENSFPGLLGNVAAGRIASRLNLGGTNCVVDAACASSLAALHLASLELTTRRADMVITGGIDTFNDIFMYMCFSKTPALSPTSDAKPFDKNCDGTILGEGIGMLVLKRLEDAKRDGDHIYAVVKGIGSSSDGRGNAIYAPKSEGQQLALRRAYESSGITPSTVELIEAHGTGTKVGDATEVESLNTVFKAANTSPHKVAVGSVKSQIGHTKAAAGVAGLIKAAMALKSKIVPPTIKVSSPMEELASDDSPFYVNTTKKPWLPSKSHPRRAGISSFGFGGTNFHCVLEEFPDQPAAPDWEGDTEILAFAGVSHDDIRSQIARMPDQQTWAETRRAAHTSRNQFRSDAQCRLLIPIQRHHVLGTLRDTVLQMLDKHPDKTHWTLPNGTAFAIGPKRGKLGALFPGQGSQYVGMLRDLACHFPSMMEALASADAVFEKEFCKTTTQPSLRLSDYIYPEPAFSTVVRQAQEERLKSTDLAQPALGAVGLGALSVMGYFGVAPEAAAGQSYGELVALCVAGRLKPDALHRLSNLRGRLMANPDGTRDRGGMITVQASESDVTKFVSEENLDLVIANRNAPTQFVLAGTKTEIEKAANRLAERSIRGKVLKVSAAFHSPLVADAHAPFAAALETVAFARGTIPVYANATAKTYPANQKHARELLANQIVKPVNFIDQVQTMFADGVGTFLELGPGHVLSDLVQSILPDKEVHTIALDASRGSRHGVLDLAIALCRLASLGHSVDLTRWENPMKVQRPAMSKGSSFSIALTGANHRNPVAQRPPNLPVVHKAKIVPNPMKVPAPIQDNGMKSAPSVAKQPTASVQTNVPPATLRSAEQGLLALQKLQEQTAQLHKQFLDGQEAARKSIEALLLQRRSLLTGEARSMDLEVTQVPGAAPITASSTSLEPETSATRRQLPSLPPLPQQPAFQQATVNSGSTIAPRNSYSTSPEIARTVLEVVAEKTGYPVEMLNLDMGLDSDLGVDSIKRVEIMASLRLKLPGSPEIKPEHLGALQSLQQVVAFLNAPTSTSAEPSPIPTTSSTPSIATSLATSTLLEVVAEKTGYPTEMLDLSMGLDADLGVDSIKRVEIMAALRTKLPTAPEVKPEHLGALQTLGHIVEFLCRADPTPSSLEPIAAQTQERIESINPKLQTDRVSKALIAVVADKTGYPPEMLDLNMGLDSDLGIDSIKRVEIMASLKSELPEAPEIRPEHLGTLQTLNQIVEFLSGDASITSTPSFHSQQKKSPEPTPFPEPSIPKCTLSRQVVQVIPAPARQQRESIPTSVGSTFVLLDSNSKLGSCLESNLQSMGYRTVRIDPSSKPAIPTSKAHEVRGLLIIWPEDGGGDALLKASFEHLQGYAADLRTQRDIPSVLATISRLDGRFGFGSPNQAPPEKSGVGNTVSGGLAGILKTASHEWPEVRCKAFDVSSAAVDPSAQADWIIQELFCVGPIEIGITENGPVNLCVNDAPLATGTANDLLAPGGVVVVTGGARGVTAKATVAFAREFNPILVLLGRTPAPPEHEPDWLQSLVAEADIKKAIKLHSDQPATPRNIESKFKELIAQREIRHQLKQLGDLGTTAIYRAVDVRDSESLGRVLDTVRRELGPIRGLIHGAGVLADKRIEDKTKEQFDLVYDTKISSLRQLLANTRSDDLKLVALFSSYTARFGRYGQVDYAAANEVMNKIAQSESLKRPNCRVVSFNWGPWNGGMVGEGLRKIFENEGIGLIDPEQGANLFVREVSSRSDRTVEVLVLAKSQHGSEPISPDSNGSDARTSENHKTLALEKQISLQDLPCLESHVMEHRPVLPAAMMVEWMCEAAMQVQPGMQVSNVRNFRVLRGIVLKQSDMAVTAQFLVGPPISEARGIEVAVEIRSVHQESNRSILHAKADILLVESQPNRNGQHRATTKSNPPKNAPSSLADYRNHQLFHGPHFQLIDSITINDQKKIRITLTPPPQPKSWITAPTRPYWLAAPWILDAAFQGMILWSWQSKNSPCLPCGFGEIHFADSDLPHQATQLELEFHRNDSAILSADLRVLSSEGHVIVSGKDFESVVDGGLAKAFQQCKLTLPSSRPIDP